MICEESEACMKAKFEPSYDKNRVNLATVLPLESPYTIFIEPTKACNFKCFYCIHSTKNSEDDAFKKEGYKMQHMDETVFANILSHLRSFPHRIKRIVFSGLGEPMLNPKLPQMVKKINEIGIVDRVDILTNASLLSPDFSDALIDAGVGRIQISIQGVRSDQYLKVAGVSIDYDKMVENIRYLYENRNDTRVFIKIIDALIENEADKTAFFETFEPICDQIYIEHLITLQPQMGDHSGEADNSKNLNNEEIIYKEICPVCFYMLQIDVEGNVFPCPVSGLPLKMSFGNVQENSTLDIWNGVNRREFLKKMLKFQKNDLETCSQCYAFLCINDTNECLDPYAEDLIDKF